LTEEPVVREDLLGEISKPWAWIFIHSYGMNLAEAKLLHGRLDNEFNWQLHFAVGSSTYTWRGIEKLGCVVKCRALYLQQFAEQIALF
jgi:hypothetical protein